MKSSAWVGLKSGNLRSTPRTKKPSFFRRFTRWDPMNPPAPRTRALRITLSCTCETGKARRQVEVRGGAFRLMPNRASPKGAGPWRIRVAGSRSFRENLVGAREGPRPRDVQDVRVGADIVGQALEGRCQQ